MNEKLMAYLEHVGRDEALFRDFAALASKHGFDLTELDEGQLDEAAGGVGFGGQILARQAAAEAAVIDQSIDAAKGSYEQARAHYRAALSILSGYQARKTEAVRKLSG